MSKKQHTSKKMAAPDTDQAFDQWVARQLHKVYDEVLSEPVPDELLRLVERFDEQPAAGKPRDGGNGCAKEPRARTSHPTDKDDES